MKAKHSLLLCLLIASVAAKLAAQQDPPAELPLNVHGQWETGFNHKNNDSTHKWPDSLWKQNGMGERFQAMHMALIPRPTAGTPNLQGWVIVWNPSPFGGNDTKMPWSIVDPENKVFFNFQLSNMLKLNGNGDLHCWATCGRRAETSSSPAERA